MIDEDKACSRRLGGRVERTGEGSEDIGDVFVEIAYFTGYGTNDFGLVGWEMR